MRTKQPDLSIIIPVYNRAHLISKTLDSIINQSFKNWECIIVDDHSQDSTLKIIQEYVEMDNRFKIYSRPEERKKGANSCRNFGLELAVGKYIHWFDSDDIAHPDCYKTGLKLIEEHQVDFCRFSRTIFRGDFHYEFEDIKGPFETTNVNINHIEKLLRNELVFNTCNVIWRKCSLGEERFNENIVYADEWEYYSRLLSNNLNGISIEKVLFFGRKHAQSTTYEFSNYDPVRRASKVEAIKLVIKNLKQKNLLSEEINAFLINFGFVLKDYSVIRCALKHSNASFIQKLKFKVGYSLYPVIKPMFILKSKFLKF